MRQQSLINEEHVNPGRYQSEFDLHAWVTVVLNELEHM